MHEEVKYILWGRALKRWGFLSSSFSFIYFLFLSFFMLLSFFLLFSFFLFLLLSFDYTGKLYIS